MSSANGKKSLALLAAGVLGSAAVSASAAPYVTVSLLGRVAGSGDPFSNSVVVGQNDVVEYQVQVLLGQEGAINPNAGTLPTSNTTTITNWVPSNGSTTPTAGLNQLRFNISQEATPGTVQADFDTPAVAASGWADASGVSGGTVTPKGNGSDDLISIVLARAPGNFDGIGLDENPFVMTLATGVFDIAEAGNASSVVPNISGYTNSVAIGGLRWRNAANTANVNYNPIALHQNNSTDGVGDVDPIIVYNSLALVPEPATVGLLGLAGAGLLARRRRA